MTHSEKMIIDLNKQFLHLSYKVAQYEIDRIEPPKYLIKKMRDVERKVRLISRVNTIHLKLKSLH